MTLRTGGDAADAGAVVPNIRHDFDGAVGLNACCDYNTRIGQGAILANGSATHHNQIIPENAFAEGVPAVVKQESITDEDRRAYFGLIPAEWTRFEGSKQEERARRKKP